MYLLYKKFYKLHKIYIKRYTENINNHNFQYIFKYLYKNLKCYSNDL
jgi:hypothetical protein